MKGSWTFNVDFLTVGALLLLVHAFSSSKARPLDGRGTELGLENRRKAYATGSYICAHTDFILPVSVIYDSSTGLHASFFESFSIFLGVDIQVLWCSFAVVQPVADKTSLQLKSEGLEVLRGIPSAVAPVVIIGPYRSGKSFLLNQLLGVGCGAQPSPSPWLHTDSYAFGGVNRSSLWIVTLTWCPELCR